jgi:ParB family transcriptional regulator, chromosome partitioning protein
MARKQSDYLASLLHDDADGGAPIETKSMPEAPAAKGAARAGTTLLTRESALARIAAGDVRQVTQMLLDPARVRIWPGNARVYADLDERGCRELIDSIVAEGGQKVPAVVRRVKDDPAYDYEVIAGTRRHFAISWLRTHSYPEMRFLAQAADLDDESAFRLADLENRARKDVTDLERARNYAAALDTHYAGHQSRMADRLRLSKGWLSKMLKVATIPDKVVAAYASPADIALANVYPLARALEEEDRVPGIFAEAKRLAAVQRVLRETGEPPLTAPDVTRRLLAVKESGPVTPDGETPAGNGLYTWTSRTGKPGLSVLASNKQGVTLRVHARSDATMMELAEAFRAALIDLDRKGRGFR